MRSTGLSMFLFELRKIKHSHLKFLLYLLLMTYHHQKNTAKILETFAMLLA